MWRGPGLPRALSVAVTSRQGLALLCISSGFSGRSIKPVYLSNDDGVRWVKAPGMPDVNGAGGVIAAASPAQLSVATDSFKSWLYHTANAGRTWQTARTENDDGLGWVGLAFTTSADGYVIHGPADADGNPDHRPGQLLLTSSSGAKWVLVRF